MKRNASVWHDEAIIRRLREDRGILLPNTSKPAWKMKTNPKSC
jgi:hypothetical protein